jgi:hypothetical protein
MNHRDVILFCTKTISVQNARNSLAKSRVRIFPNTRGCERRVIYNVRHFEVRGTRIRNQVALNEAIPV